MKSVLMSIKPKWCEKIASGKKTVEVRKSRPKLETPFKVYIYCTKDKPILGRGLWKTSQGLKKDLTVCEEYDFDIYTKESLFKANGKVIGEFVCDRIIDWNEDMTPPVPIIETCLTYSEIRKYGMYNETLYLWNISDLVIYDKPKELSEFFRKGDCEGGIKCKTCPYFEKGNEAAGLEDDCIAPFDTTTRMPITRPPQSWCYVEDNE